jgi:hypothetical protein
MNWLEMAIVMQVMLEVWQRDGARLDFWPDLTTCS